MAGAYLEVNDLTKSFRQPRSMLKFWTRPGRLLVLKQISFAAEEGESIGIVGQSGCGKTTLVKCLARLLPLDSGQILLDGTDIVALEGTQLRELRSRIQIMMQNPYSILNPQLTVLGHLRESLKLHCSGLTRGPQRDRRALELLEIVGLVGTESAYPGELSGGQRRRVCLARVLATSPDILIVDEPTTGLDAMSRRRIVKLLQEVSRQIKVLVLISHDLGDMRRLCNRVLVLHDSRIVVDCATAGFDLSGQEHDAYAQSLLEAERHLARAEKPPDRG